MLEGTEEIVAAWTYRNDAFFMLLRISRGVSETSGSAFSYLASILLIIAGTIMALFHNVRNYHAAHILREA